VGLEAMGIDNETRFQTKELSTYARGIYLSLDKEKMEQRE
jgi:hypothetical protein